MSNKSIEGLKKVYNLFNNFRIFVMNLMFLALISFVGFLFLFFAIVLFLPTPDANVMSDTLVMELDGNIVEKSTTSTLNDDIMELAGLSSSSKEIIFYNLIKGIDEATKDQKIKKMIVSTDNLNSIGFAQLRELSQKLKDFKDSGKELIFIGQNFDQKQYLLASVGSKIILDPEGSVSFAGLSSYRQYFRTALQDKLGVNIQLFKVGSFKSAAEPYILDYASDEAKQADLFWMGDIWQRYVAEVSQNRNFKPEVFNNFLNNYNLFIKKHSGDLAQLALKEGLVTDLIPKIDFMSNLKKENKTTNFFSYSLTKRQVLNTSSNKIALVVAEGTIVNGDGSSGEIGGAKLSESLNKLRESKPKAVVLRVNSPGGAVFASEEIHRELKKIKEDGIPLVVSMGNVAASGGYWISMSADKIIADPSTITGSIGIYGMIPDISKGLNKIGVTTDGVSTLESGNLDITRPLSAKDSETIQTIITSGYNKFINNVSNFRKIDVSNAPSFAEGRVWSGKQAMDLKLVDQMGGLEVAISEAAKLANLNDYKVITRAEKKEGISEIISILLGQANIQNILFKHIGLDIDNSIINKNAKSEMDFIIKSLKEGKSEVVVHCFCEI